MRRKNRTWGKGATGKYMEATVPVRISKAAHAAAKECAKASGRSIALVLEDALWLSLDVIEKR
jgi:predicted HicB family RNase H-like nuclease